MSLDEDLAHSDVFMEWDVSASTSAAKYQIIDESRSPLVSVFRLDWLCKLGPACHGTFTFYARRQNACCIFPAFSKIDAMTREAMPNDTNAKESSHRLAVRSGKELEVVRSVIRCEQLDKLTLVKRRNLQEGIPHRQRDMSPAKIQERTALQNATRRERIRQSMHDNKVAEANWVAAAAMHATIASGGAAAEAEDSAPKGVTQAKAAAGRKKACTGCGKQCGNNTKKCPTCGQVFQGRQAQDKTRLVDSIPAEAPLFR